MPPEILFKGEERARVKRSMSVRRRQMKVQRFGLGKDGKERRPGEKEREGTQKGLKKKD
jgi:hypothetical protein